MKYPFDVFENCRIYDKIITKLGDMVMKKQIKYIVGLLVLVLGVGIGTNALSSDIKISAVTSAPPAQTAPVTKDVTTETNKTVTQQTPHYNTVNPVSVVQKPSAYLNKHITMTARFSKFATLGLDYKPAMRSSETYISFLIFRPDTDKNIPLSEMKLFVTRKSAEKLIDLKEGDTIRFSGNVFSTALGDAWIDVDNIVKVATANSTKK